MGALRQVTFSSVSEAEETKAQLPYVAIPLSDFEIEVQPKMYSKSELCAMYNVSLPTFRKMLKVVELRLMELGYSKADKRLTPKMVAVLFDVVGMP